MYSPGCKWKTNILIFTISYGNPQRTKTLRVYTAVYIFWCISFCGMFWLGLFLMCGPSLGRHWQVYSWDVWSFWKGYCSSKDSSQELLYEHSQKVYMLVNMPVLSRFLPLVGSTVHSTVFYTDRSKTIHNFQSVCFYISCSRPSCRQSGPVIQEFRNWIMVFLIKFIGLEALLAIKWE